MIYDFKTRYNTTPFKGESNDGEYLVDPTGYIPSKRQVENMLYAGAQLDQSRIEDYDFRPGEKLVYKKVFDMRAPDLDSSDISRIVQQSSEGAAAVEGGAGSDDGAASGAGDSTPAGDGSDGQSVE